MPLVLFYSQTILGMIFGARGQLSLALFGLHGLIVGLGLGISPKGEEQLGSFKNLRCCGLGGMASKLQIQC